MLDSYFYHLYKKNGPNTLVSWWYMACYAYEEIGDAILTDDCFDWLAKEMDRCWDSITHHHKARIIRSACKSSVAIKNDKTKVFPNSKYPLIVMNATYNLIKNQKKYMHYTDTRPISMAELF